MAIIQYKILHRTLKRAAQERIYLRRVREWLEIPGNEYCRVYRSLPASQCHHVRGRNNTLLLDERFWLPVSDLGHRWIHERSRGLEPPRMRLELHVHQVLEPGDGPGHVREVRGEDVYS